MYRNRAIFNLSVLCAILPRVNRFLSDLSDSLSQPQITNFELDPEISKNGSRQGCGSVLQLTPATGSMLNTFIDGGLRKMVPRPRSGQFPLETKKEQDTSNLIIRDNAVVQTWELTTETEIRKHDAMTPGEGDSL